MGNLDKLILEALNGERKARKGSLGVDMKQWAIEFAEVNQRFPKVTEAARHFGKHLSHLYQVLDAGKSVTRGANAEGVTVVVPVM